MSENENVDLTNVDLTNEEVESFEIKEEKEEMLIDPLEELSELTFDENNEVNIDEYAEILNVMERDASLLKAEEADEIVKDAGDKYLKPEYLEKLKKSYLALSNFYKKYDPNSDLIKNMNETDKTNLFAVGNFINKNYNQLVDNMDFEISLTRAEYIFLSTALERKVVYDGNEVFNIIDLNEKYLKIWKENFKNLKKNEDVFNIEIDIKNIVMLYHFLQKHTVKGLSSEFYSFASVLQKIAETNKVYNAFNIKKERAKTNFLAWTSAISPEEDIIVEEN